jgi:hypothetical protein
MSLTLAHQARTGGAIGFAEELLEAGFKPPKAYTAARAAYDRLMRARAARPDVVGAVAQVTADLVERAEAGDLEPGDLTGVESIATQLALAAATEHVAKAYRAAEAALGYKLAGAVGAWLTELVPTGLRKRYLAAAAVIDSHAAILPLTLDDATALRNPALREQWLAVSDAEQVMGRAAGIVMEARNVGLSPRSERDPAGAFLMVSNPYALDDPRLLSGDGWGTIRSTLPEHSIHRLLEMSRRGAKWHLPTVAEQDAAAAAWLDAPNEIRNRMSGRAA